MTVTDDGTDSVGAQLTAMLNASPQFHFHQTSHIPCHPNTHRGDAGSSRVAVVEAPARTASVSASNGTNGKWTYPTVGVGATAMPTRHLQFHVRPLLSFNNVRFIKYHVLRIIQAFFSTSSSSSEAVGTSATRMNRRRDIFPPFLPFITLCTILGWGILIPLSLQVVRISLGYSILVLYTLVITQILNTLFDQQDFILFYHRLTILHTIIQYFRHAIWKYILWFDQRYLGLNRILGREYGSPIPDYTRTLDIMGIMVPWRDSSDTTNTPSTTTSSDSYMYLTDRVIPTAMTITTALFKIGHNKASTTNTTTTSSSSSLYLDSSMERLNVYKLKRAFVQRLQQWDPTGLGGGKRCCGFWNVKDGQDTLHHLMAMSFTHYMITSHNTVGKRFTKNTKYQQEPQDVISSHSWTKFRNKHEQQVEEFLNLRKHSRRQHVSLRSRSSSNSACLRLQEDIPLISYSFPRANGSSHHTRQKNQSRRGKRKEKHHQTLSTKSSPNFIDPYFYQPTFKTSPRSRLRQQLNPSSIDGNIQEDEDCFYQEAIELVPKQSLHTTYSREDDFYPLERKSQSSIELDTLLTTDPETKYKSVHDSHKRAWLSDTEIHGHAGTAISDPDDNEYDEYSYFTDDDDDYHRHDRDVLMKIHTTSHPNGIEVDAVSMVSSLSPPRQRQQENHFFFSETRDSRNNSTTLSPTTRKFKDLEAKWLNVGTKIGLRLLTSDPLQNNNNIPSPQRKKSMDSQSPTLISKIENKQSLDLGLRNGMSHHHDSEHMDDILAIPNLLNVDFAETRALSSPVNTPFMKPVHSLWTSPSRGHIRSLSSSNLERMNHLSLYGAVVPSTNGSNPSPPRRKDCHDIADFPSRVTQADTIKLPRLPEASSSFVNKSPTKQKTSTLGIAQSLYQTKPVHASSRSILLPGVKIVVPIFAISSTRLSSYGRSYYQMSTVQSCKRIFVADFPDNFGITNCLEIRVLLDKSFLRNAKYAEMTLRVFDRERMFRHSKFPIGSCVATTFGIGVLVGWRLEDDCHIVRSLWNKRGAGSARAFLNRESIHDVVEAAVGFSVETSRGNGRVLGYIQGGSEFRNGKFLVQIKASGRYSTVVSMVNRGDIFSCKGAKFLPVVEQIRESANYLIQLDNYESSRVLISLENDHAFVDKTLRIFSEGFELLLTSVIKAIEEDELMRKNFANILASLISFLENFDLDVSTLLDHRQLMTIEGNLHSNASIDQESSLLQRLFGDVSRESDESKLLNGDVSNEPRHDVFVVLKLIMRTVTIARASCSDRPNLRLVLSIMYEILLFVRTVIKVQKSNMSQISISAWNNTFSELLTIFGPIDRRLRKIAQGLTERLAAHGYIAKMRAAQFIEIIASDDHLLDMLEAGEYVQCVHRVEWAIVQANILQEETLIQYRKALLFLYDNIAPKLKAHGKAAARSGKKFSYLAIVVRLMATPRRSFLKYLTKDYVLDIVERVLIRVFQRQQDACQMISIFSFNFRSFRQLRILSNMAISGKLLTPILDAADEEFAWVVSKTPAQTKDFLTPLSKLFSLGVAHFHQIQAADATGDWLDFLMEEDAIRIIQQLDRTMMLNIQVLCNDVREIMDILPYYNSIDDDLLTLIDTVDVEAELKDAAEALLDETLFDRYIKEKSHLIVSKFLDYLPRISIPIDRKEIGEGWCVSCRGKGGEDLKLSNLIIQKEHVICRVLGSLNVILPISLEEKAEREANLVQSLSKDWEESDSSGNIEVSILNHIGELIRNAQSHGYYNVGVGGVCDSTVDMTSSPLDGLPLSQVLRCAIDLWKNLEMDDDELLEVAIRDISYQIELCHSLGKGRSDIGKQTSHQYKTSNFFASKSSKDASTADPIASLFKKRRFNPRKDPSLLYFEITKLNCSLEDFAYRIEMLEPRSIFDPVFIGIGSLVIKNASIMIRIECRKERVATHLGDQVVPRIHLQEFEVRVEKVLLSFKETGADWLFNSLVRNFSDSITAIVRQNLKSQLLKTLNASIAGVNSYIESNPDILLKFLGISLDDLDMNTAWV